MYKSTRTHREDFRLPSHSPSRASTFGSPVGAADLLAQLHGKPAGEIVTALHKAIRKAQGDERSETSVLYVRKH